MRAIVEIDMDNAAFHVLPEAKHGHPELSRILRYAANCAADMPDGAIGKTRLRDVNGNIVGHFTITDTE